MLFQAATIAVILQLIIWSIKHQKPVNNSRHNILEHKVSWNVLSKTPKYSVSCDVRVRKAANSQIWEPGSSKCFIMWYICLKNVNNSSIIKIVAELVDRIIIWNSVSELQFLIPVTLRYFRLVWTKNATPKSNHNISFSISRVKYRLYYVWVGQLV